MPELETKPHALPDQPWRDAPEVLEAFPEANPGVKPFGTRVLVQIRTAKAKSKGGIMFVQDTRETEQWNTQTAKVIDMGPGAYRDRDTGEPWVEGQWCFPGQFVRVPKYGGDRWEVPLESGELAMFVIFNDLEIVGAVTVDPTTIRAFI